MEQERDLAEYMAGFVDGEGCFSLSFRKDVRHERPNAPVYYSWKVLFAVVLRKDDEGVLQILKEVLGCGSITYAQAGTVRYQVGNLDDLQDKLVPFFDRHPLIGKKGQDFRYWKEAVQILHAKKNRLAGQGSQSEGSDRLKQIHASMRQFKGIYADKPLRQVSELPSV